MAKFILKFPLLKEIDYIDIQKSKQLLRSYSGKDVDGKTWREFQTMIGEEFGTAVYYYTLKQKNKKQIHKGQIRGINMSGKQANKDLTPKTEIESIKNAVMDLNKKIDQQPGQLGVETLLSLTRSGYEQQITLLNNELNRRDQYIDKIENKLDETENRLDECMQSASENNGGIAQYLTIAKEFLSMKAGNVKPISNLKDSNPNDIPPGIIEVLGVVDWSRVDPEILSEIINYLKIFIQKLPMKGM